MLLCHPALLHTPNIFYLFLFLLLQTLLFSPSSRDSHSNIAKISICQILIIFLLRGAGEMGEAETAGTAGVLTTGC